MIVGAVCLPASVCYFEVLSHEVVLASGDECRVSGVSLLLLLCLWWLWWFWDFQGVGEYT